MVSPEDLECLKRIALKGGLSTLVVLNSHSLGYELGLSPQTASRRLKTLEQQELVERKLHPEGQQVILTLQGEEALRREYCEYYRLFGRKERRILLNGMVESGLGEGAYYMSLLPYTNQFREILGFVPFPGTLNLRLSPGAIKQRSLLKGADWRVVTGFESEGRTFGEVKCLPAMIEDVPCGMVVPGRTHYPEQLLEIIAPFGIRKKFSLNDGDVITIEVNE